MAFKPDIVVQSQHDTPALVVEVKSALRAQDAPELKRYMAGMSIPIGMLISPTTLVLFRDTYRGTTEESIEEIGSYAVDGVLSAVVDGEMPSVGDPGARVFGFERTVQRWLERLAVEGRGLPLPAELGKAMEEYVLPVLREGEIRAAGPRWRRTGS